MTCTCLYLICVSLSELPSSCGELREIVRGLLTELCDGKRLLTGGAYAPLWEVRRGPCTRVTTRSAHPTQFGGGRGKPCRRVVLSGNTCPGRKPRRAHTHGVDRGKAPQATNTSCVTGSLLARVEGLEATLTPHPLIPSVPLGPSENPPQTPSKDPRKTLPRLPQRTVGKPSSDTLKGPTESPLLRAHWAHNPEDGRSFEYRLE